MNLECKRRENLKVRRFVEEDEIEIQEDSDTGVADIKNIRKIQKYIKKFKKPIKRVGKGHSRKRFKKKYKQYPPSNAFQKYWFRDTVWNTFSLFRPLDFLDVCDDIQREWNKPRLGKTKSGFRKHELESILFATLGILSLGMPFTAMEAVVGINAGELC
eukprot:178007_1